MYDVTLRAEDGTAHTIRVQANTSRVAVRRAVAKTGRSSLISVIYVKRDQR